MAATPRELPSPEAILERENAQRRVAVLTAVVSAILTAVAVLVEQLLLLRNIPDGKATDLVQTLNATATGAEPPASYIVAVGNFKLDHAAEALVVAGLRAAALALLIPIFLFLFRASMDRGAALARWIGPLGAIGIGLLAFGTLLVAIAEPAFYRDARDAGFSPGAIRDAYADSWIIYAQIPVFIGSLLACVPIALTSIQAMRLGLIPRILGFMGVLVGLLFVMQFDPSGIVRAFWFAAVAWSISGRLPGGLAAPWTTGKAAPLEPRQPPAPREPKAKKPKGDKLAK